MYLVAEPVRLVLEVFGAYDKQRLSPDMAKKRPKYDGFINKSHEYTQLIILA